MSRQIDRTALTDEIPLPGKCACPEKPHLRDWVKLRKLRSYTDDIAINAAQEEGYAAVALTLLRIHVAEWNLLGDDGEPLPITAETLNNLPGADGAAIQVAINQLGEKPKNKTELPND
jgi:hypothetical protein